MQRALRDAGLTEAGSDIDRVEIGGIVGSPPPETTKVAMFAPVGYKITNIIDVTPIPHNGCRPPKKRRV